MTLHRWQRLKTAGATTQPVLLHLSRFLPWLDVAWLLGVACLSMRTIGGWRLIQRLRRSALVEAPEAVYANFLRLRERLGITRHVSLRISEHIQGPLAIGIVRSLIILPAAALMALSPEQLEAVLAHELAHVRRADYLWNLIQTMVETLFFFHPAVWWLGRRLRQQRELCCDDVAVQSCADPLVYATALLRLEERRSQQPSLAMALDGHRPWSGLRARIARILGETNDEKGPRELVPIPLAALCAVFLLVLLPVPQLFAGLRETDADANRDACGLCATSVSSRPSDDESSCPCYIARCTRKFSASPSPQWPRLRHSRLRRTMVPRQWQLRLPKVRDTAPEKVRDMALGMVQEVTAGMRNKPRLPMPPHTRLIISMACALPAMTWI